MRPSILATLIIRLFGLLVIGIGLFNSIMLIPMYLRFAYFLVEGIGRTPVFTGKVLGFEFKAADLNELMIAQVIGAASIIAVGSFIILLSRRIGISIAVSLE